MNLTPIEKIANAILYEGYILYPYRASALKNRQRWNFGVVYPKAYSEAQNGTDAWFMQTECLIEGGESSVVNIKVRFLQAVSRQMSGSAVLIGRLADESQPTSEVVQPRDGEDLQSWQEAVERDVVIAPLRLSDLLAAPIRQTFSFPSARTSEPTKDDSFTSARRQEALGGCVEIRAVQASSALLRLTVVISNLTPTDTPHLLCRDEVLLKSFLSTHTVLAIADGDFISMIDPPAEARAIAAECKNVGTWPVLVRSEGNDVAMLSSPIILYDYPEIAPESPGDLFDGTEIDEILALRILTLSDDEKREIRRGDDRAREILERTESMPAEHFMKLHGVLRGMRPVDEAGNDGGDDAGRRDDR